MKCQFQVYFKLIILLCYVTVSYEDFQEQPFYAHEHTSLPSSSIAYGGIVNSFTNINENNTDIQLAAKFALEYSYNRSAIADTLVNTSYVIRNARQLKLIYTANDATPFVLPVDDSNRPLDDRMLVWGTNYYFTILFTNVSCVTVLPTVHQFIVSLHWNERMYLLTHTAQVDWKMQTDCQQGSSRGTCSRHNVCSSRIKCPVAMVTDVCQMTLNYESCSISSRHHYQDLMMGSRLDMFPNVIPVPSHSQTLSLLCFNLWNVNAYNGGGTKTYLNRIKRAINYVRLVDADVITFQEVRFHEGSGGKWGPNQLRIISKMLTNYQYVYQPGQIQSSELPYRAEEGVAIFSKHPIINHDYLLLHRNPDDIADGHQRVLLHAEIQLHRNTTIHILTTHLSLSHVARAKSVQQIYNRIRQLKGPVFVTGDFNAEAHNVEVQYLDGTESLSGDFTTGLRDCWSLHQERNSTTYSKGYTFNTLDSELSKRIDLIFMRMENSVILDDIKVLDTGQRLSDALSDHLPIIATFTIDSLSSDLLNNAKH